MRIEYHPGIAIELEEIRDFYESRSPGLGTEFIDAFEKHVVSIAAMPQRWMVVRGDVRRALMKRFPYVIFFRLIRHECVRFTVVKHEKRHPSYGMHRR